MSPYLSILTTISRGEDEFAIALPPSEALPPSDYCNKPATHDVPMMSVHELLYSVMINRIAVAIYAPGALGLEFDGVAPYSTRDGNAARINTVTSHGLTIDQCVFRVDVRYLVDVRLLSHINRRTGMMCKVLPSSSRHGKRRIACCCV